MQLDRYSSLLSDLGKALHINLSLDIQNACIIRLKDNLEILIEPDILGEKLLIAIELGSPAPGEYRKNMFKEALKANGLPPPTTGIFAYSAKKDTLLLTDQVPLEEITVPQLLGLFKSLVQKARIWKTAIMQTEIPSFTSTETTFGTFGATTSKMKGMFGL